MVNRNHGCDQVEMNAVVGVGDACLGGFIRTRPVHCCFKLSYVSHIIVVFWICTPFK
jgi:hypothetical protein